MSYHNKPDLNPPGMSAALVAHGFSADQPDPMADAFRLGWAAAQPGWKPQRCTECDCEHGGADCSWIKPGNTE